MALPIEAGYLFDSLTQGPQVLRTKHTIIEGELAGKLVAVVLSGPGKAAARRGAELLLAGHRPRWLISAGFAGGLDPALARNDLVLPDEVIDLGGEPRSRSTARSRVHAACEPRTAACSRSIGSSPGRPRRPSCASRIGADLVDMETSAVALLARERSLRFLPSGSSATTPGRASPRGRPAADPLGQLPRGRGPAGHLAPALGLQGLLDAARAGPRSRRPAGGCIRRLLDVLPPA